MAAQLNCTDANVFFSCDGRRGGRVGVGPRAQVHRGMLCVCSMALLGCCSLVLGMLGGTERAMICGYCRCGIIVDIQS
jgi:hypothetical protein